VGNLAVQNGQVTLTDAADVVSLTQAGVTVIGTSTTLTSADSLTGFGDTKLAIYGAGIFDLNSLAAFAGFSEVDLVDNAVGAAGRVVLNLKNGQDIYVIGDGSADEAITTSTGHAIISSTSTGRATLGSKPNHGLDGFEQIMIPRVLGPIGDDYGRAVLAVGRAMGGD
jgi:hypothetical protein